MTSVCGATCSSTGPKPAPSSVTVPRPSFEGRSPARLREALEGIASQVPLDATFGGVETDPCGLHAIRVESESLGTSLVGIGRSAQLGVTWRLLGGEVPGAD